MEFPRDIRNIIVRKLDIDSRRVFGIYSKLNTPTNFVDSLSAILNKARQINDYACVPLGPLRTLCGDEGFQQPMYMIYRFFDDKRNLIETRVHHCPEKDNSCIFVYYPKYAND